jgi:hypothetical protein
VLDYCEKHQIAFIPRFKLGGRLAGEVLTEILTWRRIRFIAELRVVSRRFFSDIAIGMRSISYSHGSREGTSLSSFPIFDFSSYSGRTSALDVQNTNDQIPNRPKLRDPVAIL